MQCAPVEAPPQHPYFPYLLHHMRKRRRWCFIAIGNGREVVFIAAETDRYLVLAGTQACGATGSLVVAVVKSVGWCDYLLLASNNWRAACIEADENRAGGCVV